MADGSMLEIERRFLCEIVDDAALRRAARESRIRQGYLTEGDPAVRIRERDGAWVLAVKSGSGRVRREVEIGVEPAAAEVLLDIASERRLEKVRDVVGRWEIDRFAGKLAGLVIAEIELERADEPLPPAPEGVLLLREITDDVAYTNQRLAALSAEDAAELVGRVG